MMLDESYRPNLSTTCPELCLDHRGVRKEKGSAKQKSMRRWF
jgi:hypothetical protein